MNIQVGSVVLEYIFILQNMPVAYIPLPDGKYRIC